MRSLVRSRTAVRLTALLLAMVTASVTATVVRATPAAASCGLVRLYRATPTTSWNGTGGTVDTSPGNFIGSDVNTGGTISAPANPWSHLAMFGTGLDIFTHPVYHFIDWTTGTAPPKNFTGTVNYQGIMRDDNYDGPNRFRWNPSPIKWRVDVDYRCGGVTYSAFLGYVQTPS